MMPPRYVKAYVKSQKNDAADAEAICEAVTRPTMRFVEIKTREQQSVCSCWGHPRSPPDLGRPHAGSEKGPLMNRRNTLCLGA